MLHQDLEHSVVLYLPKCPEKGINFVAKSGKDKVVIKLVETYHALNQ